MKVVVQRSKKSSVTVADKVVGSINHGLVLLVSFTVEDSSKEIDWMINKILHLRIFDDENKIMNKSVLDVTGKILSISQFTLYANCNKGCRPSYQNALNGKDANTLYQEFNRKLKKYIHVEEVIFGSDMLVNIENDGPVTIILEKNKEVC